LSCQGVCEKTRHYHNIQATGRAREFFDLLIGSMNFFNTFRGRLLVVLALLLITTLSVQYYLNYITEQENRDLRERQEQAIVSAIALGFRSITSEYRMQDFLDDVNQTFLDPDSKQRILDIIIIDNEWRVTDSLNPEYLPDTDDNNKPVYKLLKELTDLPPLMEEGRLGEDMGQFPNRKANINNDTADETHAVPIETSKGRWYVMVLLRNNPNEARWRAARPLVYTLGLLLASSLITFWLVWRFGRPISNLSHAARQVADGNLTVRVPDASRGDEMGRLAQNFNDMATELEKKRDLEAQLQQAEKSAVVGRLGSAIAHEIRNPLNYINLTLDHLRTKYAPSDPERKAAFDKLTGQVKNEVARINQQISDFLNYSRPAKANLRPLPARMVIDGSIRIAEAEAADKNVTIGVVEHENVPPVMGDPEFLRSVFNNLFINAVQSMEKEGGHLNIRISPSDDGDRVAFEVADTGPGISPENITKIFEPYFSTRETGTGLGLAIVHKIVEVHSGTITVDSTEGKGTKFTVTLPAANANTQG
jgi:signal transduction histidine kinase